MPFLLAHLLLAIISASLAYANSFSASIKTFRVDHQYYSLHLAHVAVQNERFTVLFDTSYDHSWLLSSLEPRLVKPKSRTDKPENHHSFYNVDSRVPVDSQRRTIQYETIKWNLPRQPFVIQNFFGQSSLQRNFPGQLYLDKLSFNDFDAYSAPKYSPLMGITAVADEDPALSDRDILPYDGVFGLAPRRTSTWPSESLAYFGPVTVAFNHVDDGYIEFGKRVGLSDDYTYTRVIGEGDSWQFSGAHFSVDSSRKGKFTLPRWFKSENVVLDSADPVLSLDKDALTEYFRQAGRDILDESTGRYFTPCDTKMPDLVVKIMKKKLVIPGKFLLFLKDTMAVKNAKGFREIWCGTALRVTSTPGDFILGIPFYEAVKVRHSQESWPKILGFAQQPYALEHSKMWKVR